MKSGLLIYNRADYEKNIWFAQKMQELGHEYDLSLELVFTDELLLCILNGSLSIVHEHVDIRNIKFVINRTRDASIAHHFEALGVKVFNSAYVTEICNNKARTHQIVNSANIKSAGTFLCNNSNFASCESLFNYPLILKSVAGHGGSEVFKVHDKNELSTVAAQFAEKQFIIQEFASNCLGDIRVYIINNQIIASVKRVGEQGFKSNISLGATSEVYELSRAQSLIVKQVTSLFKFDFVGIDFLLLEDGVFLFNEIEDAVGCRAVYSNFSFDIAKLYLKHVKLSMYS